MKNRYTVRKSLTNKSYLDVFDRLENKVVRSYPNISPFSAKSLCKYMNSQAKKNAVA